MKETPYHKYYSVFSESDIPNRTACLCFKHLNITARSHTDYYSTQVMKTHFDFKALLARSELQKLQCKTD